jgi:hypothetical protein
MSVLADVQWFGVDSQGVLDFSYTCSVGISPGVAIIRAPAGNYAPNMAGDLKFSDGIKGFTLSGCIVAPNGGFREIRSASGRIWELQILDRRWRWADGYAISGNYNQIDRHGKLIPWSIRSPFQLAYLLLTEMGEVNFSIDLPAGLATGKSRYRGSIPRGNGDKWFNPDIGYLEIGQNLPATGTNPPTQWNEIPAARALANLADQYGRVVVWDPASDQVSVVPIGSGLGPPNNGAMLVQSPGVNIAQVPAAIVAKGPPTRHQARLVFRPVGRDWDDSWQPLERLSYAPKMTPQKMRVACFNATVYTLNGKKYTGSPSQVAVQVNSSSGDATILAQESDGVLYLTAIEPGKEFNLRSNGEDICLDGPIADDYGFNECPPPLFPTVVPTEQRTFRQNLQLAQSSIWRHWQLVVNDPSDPSIIGVPIPGVGGAGALKGRLFYRYLCVLENTCPEQIVPRPGDNNRIDPVTLQPYAHDIYDGYAKDSAPKTFGGLHRPVSGNGSWAKDLLLHFGNTPPKSRFYIPFNIVDPERQIVEFARPLYRVLGGSGRLGNEALPAGITPGRAAYVPTDLVIEMGLTLLDDTTFAPKRISVVKSIPGGTGPNRVIQVPDAHAEFIGIYDEEHRYKGFARYDLYAEAALANQATATALTYDTTGVRTVTYVGIVPIPMTGVNRQATYTLGRNGFTTTVGANTEYSNVVNPFPTRRRVENLPPDDVRAMQNLLSRPPIAGNAQKDAAQ